MNPGDAALYGDRPVRVIAMRSYDHLDIRGQVRSMAGSLVMEQGGGNYWVSSAELVPLAADLPTFTSVEEADSWLDTEARIHDELAPELPARLEAEDRLTCDECGCCTWVLDVERGEVTLKNPRGGAVHHQPLHGKVRYVHLPLVMSSGSCDCFVRQCPCTRKAVPAR